MMKLSENLLQLRKVRNASRQAVADAVRISAKSYERYENGEREPTASVLIALADYFGVTLDDLVGRTPPES